MIDKVGRRAFHPHFHTAQASDEEVRIEVLAAKLSVSDGLQSNLLLLRDDPADSCILDGFQFLSRDFSFGSILAGLLEVRRPQQTAYVVSAKWRVMWSGGCHESSSCYLEIFFLALSDSDHRPVRHIEQSISFRTSRCS
jgi:hypothetical protein